MNELKENIKIEGFVEIRNGDTIIKGKNKFVQTLLQTILNFLASSTAGSSNGGCTSCVFGPADPNLSMYQMYIGTDTGTVTAYNTTALTSPIVPPAPGTAPTVITASQTNPSNGVFQINITARWDAGTVSGTVGEMALYMNLFAAGNLRAFQWSSTYIPSNATLASRFAVADGVFSQFAINVANPLIIVWTIQLSFV